MCIYYDITTSNKAFEFLLNELGFCSEDLIMEFHVNCNNDIELFWERNKHHIENIDINQVRFVAFHVTGSLDDCSEINTFGIRNLQYVLSHNTKLSCLLKECGISFNIEKRTMSIGNTIYNIDFDYYCNCRIKSSFDEKLKSVAHRVFYDFCVDGFMYNDYIESYGTDIHKRPEFIRTLIDLSDEAQKLDAYWKAKSKPYKVVFYATAEQIHKFTFGELNRNNLPYTEYEQNVIKKWMLINAVDRAFEPCRECFIYIRDDTYIPANQIIRCEKMS